MNSYDPRFEDEIEDYKPPKTCPRCENAEPDPLSIDGYCRKCTNIAGGKRRTSSVTWEGFEALVRAKEQRKPRLHIYARVSTLEQARSGESLNAQIGTCLKWFDEVKEQKGWEEEPFIYRDEGTSSFHVPLLKRPIARELVANLVSGDTIVIWSLERGFRNSYDYHCAREAFKRVGISLVIYQLKELSEGEFSGVIEAIFAAIAETDSSIKSKRIRAAQQESVEQGIYPYHCKFFKRWKKGKRTVFAPVDEETGWVMKTAYGCWKEGVSRDIAGDLIELLLAEKEKRDPITRFNRNNRKWSNHRIMRAAWAWRKIALPRDHEHAAPWGEDKKLVSWLAPNGRTEKGKEITHEVKRCFQEFALARKAEVKERRIARRIAEKLN